MTAEEEKSSSSEEEEESGEEKEEKQKEEKKDSDNDTRSDDDSEWASKVSDKEVRHVIRDLAKEESDEEGLVRKSDPRCRKAKNLVREYAQAATMHGMNHLGEAHTCAVIIFWSLMLLICLLLFTVLFRDTFLRYLRFESAVGISMEMGERTFPAVSLCNLSPYSLSGLEGQQELNALVLAFDYAINNKISDIEYWNQNNAMKETT